MRIETERLVLRRWESGDVDQLAHIHGDPVVAQWLGALTQDDAARTIERYERHWDAHGFGRFAVEDRVTGRLVGRVGIMRQPVWNETPEQDEVGWVIASERWGVGLATEAAHAAIADVFERIELTRVLSWTEPGNAASLRVMAKLGLARGGMVEWKGSEHVWCSLTTEAFAAHSLEEQVSD